LDQNPDVTVPTYTHLSEVTLKIISHPYHLSLSPCPPHQKRRQNAALINYKYLGGVTNPEHPRLKC